MEETWPCNGRLRHARDKRFAATVVFIHHFGGNRSSTRRHQDMVLDMGLDCFSFDLSFNRTPKWTLLNSLSENALESWTRELELVLNALPGDKILYSFSFPSTSVPTLLARRPRTDIKAWICDGGPFLEPWRCLWNYFIYAEPTPRLTKRFLLTCYSYVFIGGPLYETRIHDSVSRLDPGLPILSVRSGRDVLVPERAIDRVFKVNPRLNLNVLRLPEAPHLEGFKQQPEKYTAAVREIVSAAAISRQGC
ncbi:MAG: alpha/beta fold hydrolase [Bdellovibrionales bacterium]